MRVEKRCEPKYVDQLFERGAELRKAQVIESTVNDNSASLCYSRLKCFDLIVLILYCMYVFFFSAMVLITISKREFKTMPNTQRSSEPFFATL